MELENINLLFDFVLIITSVWMINAVKSFGGMLGNAFNLITWGGIILGLAHLSETLLFRFSPDLSTDFQEMLHRLIVFVGFVLITIGFQKLSQINKK